MNAHIAAVSITLIIYLILGLAYYGWGRVLTKILKIDNKMPANGMKPIWLGWAITLLLFQALNFFFPVTAYIVIPIFLFGVVLSIPEIIHAVKSIFGQFALDKGVKMITGVLFLLVCIWVISRSMLSPTIYDSGLYHLNAIRWINTYPVIPGLGNVHGRLAFNQSFFTYAAALNFYPFGGFGRSLANSFLFLLLVLTLFASPVSLRLKDVFTDKHPYLYLPALFLLPIVVYIPLITSNKLSSVSSDFASMLLQVVLFVELVHGIGEWLTCNRNQDYRAIFLVVLATTAVTVKLSNLMFSMVVIGMSFIYVWQTSQSRIQNLVRMTLPVILIMAVWGSRGYLLSGAPLYPSTIGYLHFEWSVPVGSVRNMTDLISSWARQPGISPDLVLGNWDWLKPWSIRISKDLVGVVYPSLISLVFYTIAIGLRRKNSMPRVLEWWFFPPLILGIVYWFFTAPDPRFANSVFWLLLVGSALVLLASLQRIMPRGILPVMVCIVFTLANLGFAKSIFTHLGNLKDVSLSGWHPLPEVSLMTQTTDSGLVMYVPKEGDRCWDSPLPCTPYFNPDLRLRIPGDISSGFVVSK